MTTRTWSLGASRSSGRWASVTHSVEATGGIAEARLKMEGQMQPIDENMTQTIARLSMEVCKRWMKAEKQHRKLQTMLRR